MSYFEGYHSMLIRWKARYNVEHGIISDTVKFAIQKKQYNDKVLVEAYRFDPHLPVSHSNVPNAHRNIDCKCRVCELTSLLAQERISYHRFKKSYEDDIPYYGLFYMRFSNRPDKNMTESEFFEQQKALFLSNIAQTRAMRNLTIESIEYLKSI